MSFLILKYANIPNLSFLCSTKFCKNNNQMSNYKRNGQWFKTKHPTVNPELIKKAIKYEDSPEWGYDGFKLYFPGETSCKIEETIENVKYFENFIKRNQSIFLLADIEKKKFFTIDYMFLISNEDELSSQWTNLKTDIDYKTEYCLNCMGLAMHQFILNDFDSKYSEIENKKPTKNLKVIRCRLINYEPILQLKDLRVNYFGKLVAVRGTVIKAAAAKIQCEYMAFSCSTCTGIQIVKQCDGAFTAPSKCPTPNCRAQSNFVNLHASPFTRTVSYQRIKIQELIGDEQYENGRIPRTLECELSEDLVSSCVPGDDVTITGVVKVPILPEASNKNKQNATFLMHLFVISVVNNKNQSQSSYGAAERITFNIDDYYAIQKIHSEPQLFRYLVQSLCPNIYGHEIVKAGLLLSLFGGAKSADSIRSESHILMIGDPGLGKSQMLLACSNITPRGVYVCGNASTGSGLTVTLTRESGREYSMEAGALMLADQGCCCIDEFDKMPTQHACLLEAMEQQSISIAKAGIVCTLPTRATILAAANPAGGHYNKSRTVAENLKISSPMLSRFDLIFILLDQPNEQLDKLLSEHVLALHTTKKSVNNTSISFNTSEESSCGNLKKRLSVSADENIDPLPHSLFRKYVAYAQKYVNPQLSDEAKQVLEQFYLKLRKQFRSGDCAPVTTRQLHSLIRLTQARAKLELREEATESDALDVIEIMKNSLNDIFTDDTGTIKPTRSQNGTGMSTRNQIVKLLRLLQRESENQTKSLFTVNEIREISESAGICSTKFFNVLQSLNIQGFLLNKGGNKYQLISADL